MMQRQGRTPGFTLVEMLIALSLFAIISSAGILLLRASISTQASVAASLSESSAIMRLRAMLSREALSAQPRTTRDTSGAIQPAVVGTATSLMLIHATDGDSASAESAIAFARYRLDGNRLVRDAGDRIDGIAPDTTAASVIVGDVESVGWRYRGSDGNWADRWVPDRPDRLPRAVELTITRTGGARVAIAFQFAPDGLPPPGTPGDPS